MIFPSSHDFHGHLTGMATSGWTAPGGPREGGRILGDVGPEGATHGALDQRVAEHQKSGNLGPKMGPKSVDFRGKMNEIEHEHDKPWDLGVILCYIYVYIYDIIWCYIAILTHTPRSFHKSLAQGKLLHSFRLNRSGMCVIKCAG
jgi:hypothetical protein